MADDLTYPVQVLRAQLTDLTAALAVCLEDDSRRDVHRLRTTTRRVEAELELLDRLPQVPEHRDEDRRLRRVLKRLRRGAGAVRDLDVHCKRLEDLQESMKTVAGPETEALRRGAAKLLRHLEADRDTEAKHLRKLLKRQGGKLVSAAEDLLAKLAHAEVLSLTGTALVVEAEALPTRDGLLARDPATLKTGDLHSLRKSAKAARYMAETAAGSAPARAVAQHFQSLQGVGGEWHDALELCRQARRVLGRGHELTVALQAERDRLLQAYQGALRGERAPRKKPSSASRPAAAEKRRPAKTRAAQAAA